MSGEGACGGNEGGNGNDEKDGRFGRMGSKGIIGMRCGIGAMQDIGSIGSSIGADMYCCYR